MQLTRNELGDAHPSVHAGSQRHDSTQRWSCYNRRAYCKCVDRSDPSAVWKRIEKHVCGGVKRQQLVEAHLLEASASLPVHEAVAAAAKA